MPIYAYRCGACGLDRDVLQKISDPVLTVCPECGAEAFAKQLTAAGFQLKGSGWYVTDFRDGGNKAKRAKALTPTEPMPGPKPVRPRKSNQRPPMRPRGVALARPLLLLLPLHRHRPLRRLRLRPRLLQLPRRPSPMLEQAARHPHGTKDPH